MKFVRFVVKYPMAHDGHHHDHGQEPPSDIALRVKALETVLTEKGLIDPAALDAIIDTYEHKVGPRNGARVVARAWSDPAYRARLMTDATAAIAELDISGRQGEHMVAVENTPAVHNLVVCTLCSCYPWSVLGLPPTWYKSNAYRSRAVIDPRGVLAEFGVAIDPEVEVRVWDSTAEVRYLVIPQRPMGTERSFRGGAGRPRHPRRHDRDRAGMNGVHDMGGMHGLGPVAPDPSEPLFHGEWERRVLAMTLAMGSWGCWNIDVSRHARESIQGDRYLAMTYYERWFEGLTKLIDASGLADEAVPAGAPLTADRVAVVTKHRSPYTRPATTAPAFAVGDRVRARTINPLGHTRLPRYARGHVGVIATDHGSTSSPTPTPTERARTRDGLYGVRFTARELWGKTAAPTRQPSTSICGSPTLNPPEPRAFEEPWQAQAFALTLDLHGRGAFTWTEWAAGPVARAGGSPRMTVAPAIMKAG